MHISFKTFIDFYNTKVLQTNCITEKTEWGKLLVILLSRSYHFLHLVRSPPVFSLYIQCFKIYYHIVYADLKCYFNSIIQHRFLEYATVALHGTC